MRPSSHGRDMKGLGIESPRTPRHGVWGSETTPSTTIPRGAGIPDPCSGLTGLEDDTMEDAETRFRLHYSPAGPRPAVEQETGTTTTTTMGNRPCGQPAETQTGRFRFRLFERPRMVRVGPGASLHSPATP